MKKTDNCLERLIQLASQEDRVYSPATIKLENDVIRAWRYLSEQGTYFVRDLSIAFIGGFSLALVCFLFWFSTAAPIVNDEIAFEDSIEYLFSSSL